MKFMPLSVAIAFAIIVLLHPGGPYSSTPCSARGPELEQNAARTRARTRLWRCYAHALEHLRAL